MEQATLTSCCALVLGFLALLPPMNLLAAQKGNAATAAAMLAWRVQRFRDR